jgi:hypothetical protein
MCSGVSRKKAWFVQQRGTQALNSFERNLLGRRSCTEITSQRKRERERDREREREREREAENSLKLKDRSCDGSERRLMLGAKQGETKWDKISRTEETSLSRFL